MPERCIRLTGGTPLAGSITISGAKNAALPCMFATLLTDSPCQLDNLPAVADTSSSLAILASLGHVSTQPNPTSVELTPEPTENHEVPLDFARAMRASILALGPLLAKRGTAVVPLPGGCDFGSRPVDIHLHGLEALGAHIKMQGGVLYAHTEGLKGARLVLEYPTFTGTENLLMAATLAQGTSIIENAAREPEVIDLAELLTKMGAKIQGAGTSTIEIEGVAQLGGAQHTIMSDRIEAGTYLAAVMATGGEVKLANARAEHLALPLEKFVEAKAVISTSDSSISLSMDGRPQSFSLTTAPYPGFPTDLQAQSLAVNCVAEGTAEIVDQVWQQRFRTADELALFGAHISVHGNCATVTGTTELQGAHVQASDLRASAALVIGGLAAQGETTIHGVNHLERGYADLPGKLRALGAAVSVDKLVD